MPKLKAIFFDIDNTLFPTSEFTVLARKRAVRAMVREGLPFGEKEAYKRLLSIVERYGSNYPHHFDILLRGYKIKRSPKLVASAVIAYHEAKKHLTPYPDVPGTLRLLRSKGFRVYALSRGVDVKQWDKLIRLGLHRIFEEVFVTREKDAHFYRSVLTRLKLKPGEAAMVGDYPRIDILPAKKAGFLTIHLMKGKHAKDPDGRKADFQIRAIRELPVILK